MIETKKAYQRAILVGTPEAFAEADEVALNEAIDSISFEADSFAVMYAEQNVDGYDEYKDALADGYDLFAKAAATITTRARGNIYG